MITQDSLPKYQRMLLSTCHMIANANLSNEDTKNVLLGYCNILGTTKDEIIPSIENLIQDVSIWTGCQKFNRIFRENYDSLQLNRTQVQEYKKEVQKTLEKLKM